MTYGGRDTELEGITVKGARGQYVAPPLKRNSDNETEL